MEIITVKSTKARVKKVKSLIESTGNKIGSVWFKKRSDDSLRKLSFRLHVKNPSYAPIPKNKSLQYGKSRKEHDSDNMQLTVFDVNKVLRATKGQRKGKISGRGAYRTIPLERVMRICVAGTIYRVKNLELS